MKSTFKIFQLLHTGEHDPVSAEVLENLIHPYFDALKIIYNTHKSDRINLDFNVKFYEVIKKQKIWGKLVSWGNSPSTEPRKSNSSPMESGSSHIFLRGWKKYGVLLWPSREGSAGPQPPMSCLLDLCVHTHTTHSKNKTNTLSDLWMFYFISVSLTATINQAVHPLSFPHVL